MSFSRRSPRNAAFTLIELMVTLGIILMLVGIGMYAGKFWSEEEKLHKPMDEMKVMAKKAIHRAIAEQRDWEIIIDKHSLELRPKQAANEADQKFLDAADAALQRGPGVESVGFEDDIQILIRRFGEEKWREPGPDKWVFQHSGICEPIHYKVVRGNRYMETGFDPLTAGAIHEDGD